jgi:hypothetical protein
MNHELHIRFRNMGALLLNQRNKDGFWEGMLSSSALSTATAVVALKKSGNKADGERITQGLRWLKQNRNDDGGFGDTAVSISNVSTSLLVYAALYLCKANPEDEDLLNEIRLYLASHRISPDHENLVASVLAYYGRDFTFSVPILSMLTICGAIPEESIRKVPQLPFELAVLPASWYRFLNLHVVSYALPALIGVGIYIHSKRRSGALNLKGFHRNRFIKPAIKKLERIMPESGGFLEAIPLTAFVSMCLTESGIGNGAVVIKGLDFLRSQQRKDGSWPIDTNLSTWVTTLAIKALGPQMKRVLGNDEVQFLRKYLLSLQYKFTHSFNGAAPGGWGWTGYSGSVPDADDTSGAILALLEVYSGTEEEAVAIANGCNWLLSVQNEDGGFPTFCRGWGKLPFDRSSADLTGHALLALLKTSELLQQKISPGLLSKIDRSIHMAMGYLTGHQSETGAWLPLWFGNQLTPDKTNPVYGTARVCIYLGDCLAVQYPDNEFLHYLGRLANKARNYLLTQQNEDGSWGGEKGIPGTVEETSLAICALASDHETACVRGLEWLGKQDKLTPSPIGLYFALLWYDEKLYPLIYYTEALRRFLGY